MKPNKDLNPIAGLVYETYHNSIVKDLDERYFSEYGNVDKWICSSDYSFDKRKSNHVISFSFFPYIEKIDKILNIIKSICPKDIKKTRNSNSKFIDFLKESPFLNFSIILKNYDSLVNDSKELMAESLVYTLKQLQESISVLNYSSDEIEIYYGNILKKLRKLIMLVENGKKLRIIKKMFLITSIGSILTAQIANRTNAKLVSWFSDRDEINDVADNISMELFHMLFSDHLVNPDCKFISTLASSKDDKWHGELIKIPDYYTGVIADYDFDKGIFSHKKFEEPLRKLIANNRRNSFIIKLNFNDNSIIRNSRLL